MRGDFRPAAEDPARKLPFWQWAVTQPSGETKHLAARTAATIPAWRARRRSCGPTAWKGPAGLHDVLPKHSTRSVPTLQAISHPKPAPRPAAIPVHITRPQGPSLVSWPHRTSLLARACGLQNGRCLCKWDDRRTCTRVLVLLGGRSAGELLVDIGRRLARSPLPHPPRDRDHRPQASRCGATVSGFHSICRPTSWRRFPLCGRASWRAHGRYKAGSPDSGQERFGRSEHVAQTEVWHASSKLPEDGTGLYEHSHVWHADWCRDEMFTQSVKLLDYPGPY